MSLADAGGRLMYAYKDLLELAGLTTRLYTLLSTLHHLKPLPEFVWSPESVEFKKVVVGIPKRVVELGEAPLASAKTSGERSEEMYDLTESLLEGTGISEDRALVRGLSLRIERGEHLMITGPVRPSEYYSRRANNTDENAEWSGQDGYRPSPCWPLGTRIGHCFPTRAGVQRCVCCTSAGVYGRWKLEGPVCSRTACQGASVADTRVLQDYLSAL